MKQISIFNHVIGPVMRGPSSSHTAGAYHIGAMARSLLGGEPATAAFSVDAEGSYAKTFREQGADLAFAAGLMGWEITDERFEGALDAAAKAGLTIDFAVERLTEPEHPNTVDVRLTSTDGRELLVRANSIGGGAVEVTQIGAWRVRMTGETYEIAVEVDAAAADAAVEILTRDAAVLDAPARQEQEGSSLVSVRRRCPLADDAVAQLRAIPGVGNVWACEPIYFVHQGEPVFTSAEELIALAGERGSLGQAALAYESALLGLSGDDVLAEAVRRFEIMQESVRRGLDESPPTMQLLTPSAGKIYAAEARGDLPGGGLHARAAARAMAVMHVNGGMGVVCAAPTGGAAGTLPGVLVTLAEERSLSRDEAAMALLAAGAIGVVVANRATFAAEVAGCQVEIGAAGAMAAAAVVDVAEGAAKQAADAAAIAFQNTMGSVCDLVQGIVEIPCHTRNAAAASNAFLCADLILGGYVNPVGLDETIDAVYSVGKMLPPQLRCTALGGLAVTPSALAMKRLR